MGAEIRIYTIGDSWALMPTAHGNFVNNGNVNLYIQQQSSGVPGANDAGARIRPGGSFFVSHELYKITYLRTLSGTTTIANYEDRNNGSGSASIVDPASGNHATINSTGQLHVVLRGEIDSANSTSTPLAENGVFTGEAINTLDYAIVNVAVFSDVASATDGLSIQQSCDGEHWDVTDEYTIPANAGKTFSVQTACPYYRLVYTNGATAQTAFRLSSVMKKNNTKPSSHRISDSIISDDDATLTKAVITGQRDDGTFTNGQFDDSDRLKVVAQDYAYAIAEGRVPHHYPLFKFGTRSSVAANTQSLVWEGPTAQYQYLAAAEQVKITSSAATDSSTGTGARTLTLIGLDSNYNEISETITMNGITAVTSTFSYLRLFRAFVDTCGTSYANDGNITITNNAGTSTLLYIPALDGQTLMTMWTVPLGKVAYLTQISASTNSNKGARMSVFTRYNDGGILYPWRIRYRSYLFSGDDVIKLNIPLVLQEKTDIEIRVLTPTSAGDTSMGATFELWYEDA